MELIPVNKDVFYATVGPLNVHPRSERDASYWELRDRQLIGKTTPGYMGGETKQYFLAKILVK